MNRIPSPRDVIIMQADDTAFVSAVDSCGAIGMLPHDLLSAAPELVGCFTARVALLEILAVGAEPAFASVPICNAPQVAEQILVGIRKVLGVSVPLIISTEKNMPTTMTALGVSVTGTCKVSKLRICGAKPGDVLYCAGVPHVGRETLAPDVTLLESCHVTLLLQNPRVHGIIPVGSKGIAAESKILAEENGLHAVMDENFSLDLNKSAGPSSCAVFAARPDAKTIGFPLTVTRIGRLG